MLIVLSPAKTLDFSKTITNQVITIPVFLKEAEKLVKIARKFKPAQLSLLMGISAKLADLNFERFLKWEINHSSENSKQALFAFKGDVYLGLDSKSLNEVQLSYLNNNLRILSGLYGSLKPFDLIQEYRLEMGTQIVNPKGNDLYKFWGKKITNEIIKALDNSYGEKVLINLASNEYFKSIVTKDLKNRIITPVFKEQKEDGYHFVSFFAKKARGLMTRFIALNNINQSEDIKHFNLERYAYNEDLSKHDEWVFTR